MLCTLYSCNDEESVNPKITANFSEINADGNGEVRSIDLGISSDEQLNIKSSVEWVEITDKIHDSKATTAKSYRIIIEKNTTGSAREGDIVVSLGETVHKIKVKQRVANSAEPKDLTLSDVSATIPNIGGEVSCYVDSNTDWKLSIDGDWCSVKSEVVSGSGCKILTFTAQANPLFTVRSATVTVTTIGTEKIKHSLTISQDQLEHIFVISSSNIRIGKIVDSKTSFTIKASSSWKLSSQAKWLSFDITQSTEINRVKTIEITATESNNTGVVREATITVANDNDTLATIKVLQEMDELVHVILTEKNTRVSTYQPGDGSVAEMFDGDNTTYFTSNWAGFIIKVPQWVVVDLGEGNEANSVGFKYTTRDRSDATYTPTNVKIEATNEAPTSHIWTKEGDIYTDSDRTWVTLNSYHGEVNCPQGDALESPMLLGDSDTKYRYWRFNVAQAVQSAKWIDTYPDAFCFHIAELKVIISK